MELHTLDHHKDSITSIQMSNDKHYLISSGNDGNVIFWDAKVNMYVLKGYGLKVDLKRMEII